MNFNYQPRGWMKGVLAAAGIYNLGWGFLTITLPEQTLGWLGVLQTGQITPFWQCIGMIVGVYGVGYLIAARDPFRHWPIVLVGLLGKLLGPIGLVFSVASGSLPASFGWNCLANDLIWWVPFTMILWGALRVHQAVGSAYDSPESDDPVRDLRTNTGQNLRSLSDQQPQLVIFLRHSGCTFCREAMSDLAAQRSEIEAAGCGIVLVHLSDDDEAEFFEKYDLADIPRIADPDCRLYRQFGLDLGGFTQLFGLRVVIRGIIAGVFRGHGIGPQRGKTFQMPGVFLYSSGRVLDGYLHDQASDRPDYIDLARRNLALAPMVAAG